MVANFKETANMPGVDRKDVYDNPFDDYDWFVINNISKKVPQEHLLSWAMMGLSAEVGEVLEVHEKALRKNGYVSDLDKAKIEDEIGDVLWYLTALAYLVGSDLTEVVINNTAKLKARGNK